MSGERMMEFLTNCSTERQLEFRIVTQCAPVLKGIKLSNMVTVKPGQGRLAKNRLMGTKIACILLYSDEEKEILFLYRLGMMETYLKKPDVRRFLSSCGYVDPDLAAIFSRLRIRYQHYVEGLEEFPHELGVFLEYPIADVKGFIRNKGKNCMTERYWKVYQNMEEAKRKFRMYDEAKECAMEEMAAGYPLVQIAVSVNTLNMKEGL